MFILGAVPIPTAALDDSSEPNAPFTSGTRIAIL
jgi:hypothetical protein